LRDPIPQQADPFRRPIAHKQLAHQN
jgi:hypothetical protein